MAWSPPTYTDEERLASTEAHAAHWENEARHSPPDIAANAVSYRQQNQCAKEPCGSQQPLDAGGGRSLSKVGGGEHPPRNDRGKTEPIGSRC